MHIQTDKPFYKPNEVVFVEAFLIDSMTKKPLFMSKTYPNLLTDVFSERNVYAQAWILDSFKNEVHAYETLKLYNGTFVFSNWKIPADFSGGEYEIKVEVQYGNVPPSFRKIRIGAYSQPEMFVTLDFDKNAYSVGDKVLGKVKVRKPDGTSLPVGSSVAFDVQGYTQKFVSLDRQGEA